MMIHKITPSIDENLWLKSLNIELNEPANQNSLKSTKSTNKKCYYKTLGTSVLNSPLSFFSLRKCTAGVQRNLFKNIL